MSTFCKENHFLLDFDNFILQLYKKNGDYLSETIWGNLKKYIEIIMIELLNNY